MKAVDSIADSIAEGFDGMEQLEGLFVGHMRARVMLRDVAQAEQDALAEIVMILRTVPRHLRRHVVATCVERAAVGLIADPIG